jgi:hypothetical protein
MRKLALISTMLVFAAATAQAQKTPLTELLERGIYAEETVGDLNQAIAIYSKIVKDDKAQRPEVAQALFRLAVCHSHLGHEDKSDQLFHQLIDEYSDQTALVAEARKLVTPDSIALGSIPWKSGEVAFYDVKRSGGGKIGAAAFSTNETLVDGRPAWKLSTYTSVLISGQTDYTDTYVTRDDFTALSGNSFNPTSGQNRIDYKKSGLHVSSLVKGKKTANDIALDQPYYNDLQMHNAIRRLSLKSGYQTEFTLFIQGSTLALNARLAVKGLEKVGTPAGNFDCYRVEIKAYQQSKLMQEMTYWISTTPDKQIVKILSSSITYELTAVANRNDQPLVYQKQSLNLSLTVPQGWMPLEIEPMQPEHDMWLALIPDESHTFTLLAATQRVKASSDDKNEKRVARIVDGDIKALSSALPGFVLRPDTRVKLAVSGASAERFVADFEADNKPMVEYRTYILAPSGLFWFTFRTERDIFNEKRAGYDAIVDNLALN